MLLNNVLVVGGSGFIGSRLMKHHSDWVNVDLKQGKDFCKVDCSGFDAIILLAAELGTKLEDYRLNLRIYEGLARAVSDSEKPPFVLYISSAAVYESSTINMHYEDEMPKPAILYGKSKLLGEQVVQDLCKDYVILRLSNVFGDGDGHGVIDLFKMGGNTIFGDGQQVRDYIHVDKVVAAIDHIVVSPQRYLGETYNVSTGVGRTTEAVFNLYGHGNTKYLPARDMDIACSILDNTKAKEDGLL